MPINGNVFLDTNILIYLYSTDEPNKRQNVEKLFAADHQTFIRTQVLNEFVNVMNKKLKHSYSNILEAVRELNTHNNVAIVNPITIEKAILLAEKHSYTFFDSLMLASALESNCSIFFTEDMHNGHVIEGMSIKNPFQ